MATAYPCNALLLIVWFAALADSSGGSRCFQYSWLGPAYQNQTVLNNDRPAIADGKCADLKPRRLPCIDPIIITPRGTGQPDADQLLRLYGEEVQCVPGGGDVCVTSTFYFRNQVVNVTSYCTHVSINGGSALHDGCESAQIGAYTNKMCACDPQTAPCTVNKVWVLLPNLWVMGLAMSFLFIL